MKAILEFNLPEDQEEYDLATKAGKLHSTLWDFSQWLRGKIKYENSSRDAFNAYEECRSKLFELNESDIEL